ncbi:hypothetical protein [Piscirickettsia salmonis]|nr:hypothetical protein [Piscirickettsia salmonis]
MLSTPWLAANERNSRGYQLTIKQVVNHTQEALDFALRHLKCNTQ